MNDKEDVRRLLVPPEEEYGEPVSARESWVFWLTVIACGGLMFFAVVQVAKHIHWSIDLLLAAGMFVVWVLYRLWRS